MEGAALAVALGAAVGLILALTGAGGGILAVPLLVFGLHLPMARSAPVGLIAVGLSAAVGAALGLRDGHVRYRAAALMGVVGMALAPVGVRLARVVPNEPLTLAFACVLAWVAVRMLRASLRSGTGEHVAPAPKPPCLRDPVSHRFVWTLPCGRALAATGVVSGILSGLLGVGGGFVIVPSLTRFTDLDTRSILATSLAVIALVSVGGVGAAAAQGMVAWDIAVPFAGGAVAALALGRQVAARLEGARLRQAFAVTSLGVAVLMVCKALGWIAL
jgi:uncharacterized protein